MFRKKRPVSRLEGELGGFVLNGFEEYAPGEEPEMTEEAELVGALGGFLLEPETSESESESEQSSDEEAVIDVLSSLVLLSAEQEEGEGEEEEEGNYIEIAGVLEDEADPVAKALAVPDSAEALQINLEDAIDRGELSYDRAAGATRWADNEVRKLINAITTYGQRGDDGQYHIAFGMLCDQAGSAFWGKSLSGTLKTAKAIGVVKFDASTLFYGAHNALDIALLRESLDDSAPRAYTFGQMRQMSARRKGSSRRGLSVRGRDDRRSTRRGFQPSFADDVLANMDALDALDAAEDALAAFAAPAAAPESESEGSDLEAVEDVLASLAAQVDEETEEMATAGDAHDVALAVPSSAPILRKSLRASVRNGGLSAIRAEAATRWMDKEMRKLIGAITKFGRKNADGALEITFKDLRENASGVFWGTALQGALKTARDQKIVSYKGAALMKGVSDKVVITLAKSAIEDSTTETYTFEHIRQVSMKRGAKPSFTRKTPRKSFSHSFRQSVRSRRGMAPASSQASSDLEKTLNSLASAETVLGSLDVDFVDSGQGADVEVSLEAEEEAVAEAEVAARKQAETAAVTQMFAQARIRAEKLAQQRAFAEAEEHRRVARIAEQEAAAATRARLEAETRIRIEAEVRARIEAEMAASREAEEQKAQTAARLEAQRKAEARAKAKAEADLAARKAAEEQARQQHEAMVKAQEQARAKAAAAAAAKAEAEALAAKAEADRSKADAELQQRTEALRVKTSAVADRIRQLQAQRSATKAPAVRVSIRRRKANKPDDQLDATVEKQEAAVDDVLASMNTIHRRATLKGAAAAPTGRADSAAPASTSSPAADSAVIPDDAPILSRKLSVSVKKGELTEKRAIAATRWADGVMAKVVQALKAFGTETADGKYEVTYGVLFDATDNLFESLSGALRTAKNQKIIAFKAPMLLKGAHDREVITLLKTELEPGTADTYNYQQIRQMSSRRKKPSARSGLSRGVAGPPPSASAGGISKDSRQRLSARRGGLRRNPSGAKKTLAPPKAEEKPTPSTPAPAASAAASATSVSTGSPWKSKNRSRMAASRASKRSMRNKSGEASDDKAVVDVMATLTGIHRRSIRRSKKGAPAAAAGSPAATSATQAASEIPDDSPALKKTLSNSVRRGELSNKRAVAATRWVDKEIRKLIAAIKSYGTENAGKYTVTFGVLYEPTQNHFEALSGTLRTAKKHKVVSFEAEVLFKGTHDGVVITLLKEEHEDSDISKYTYQQVRQCSIKSRKGKAFGSSSLQTAQSKCHVCNRTVYPMEFVGASDKAFHKTCFRCVTCKTKLLPTAYATVGDKFYCQTHYDQAFKAGGGSYDFK